MASRKKGWIERHLGGQNDNLNIINVIKDSIHLGVSSELSRT
jgi:hypothetical protein